MLAASPLAYLRNHWVGLQGIGWSFWVNLVALSAILSISQTFFGISRTADAAPLNMALAALWIVAHLAVFVWQVVGVLRASELHIRHLGSITSTWGAQIGILIMLFFLLSDNWGVWLMANPKSDLEDIASKNAQAHADKYALLLSPDLHTLLFSGEIAFGSTKSVAAFLQANSDIETLALSSDGGNIYEARGLAKLANDAGLDTLVTDRCSSACTIAFVGGISRRIAPGARLGFHQYQFAGTYETPFVDPLAEQQHDMALFREYGVEDWFVRMMFHRPPEEIWFPSTSILQKAGILVSN